MTPGGYDLIVDDEVTLGKVLDWAQSKFPVSSEWDDDGLWIYLPGHNDWQGMIQILCDMNGCKWTVVVDIEFKDELLDAVR